MPLQINDLANQKSRIVDIHVVANRLSDSAIERISEMGFDSKTIVGGDPRVRMQYLFSSKQRSIKESDEIYTKVVAVCESDPTFDGYVEQELTTEDVVVMSDAADLYLPSLNIALEVSECPKFLYKGCDIHFAVTSAPSSFDDALISAGFYFLVLRKPTLGDVKIYTMQFERVEHGMTIWKELIDFVKSYPGVTCDAKFEVTRNLMRTDEYRLPPLVLKEHPPAIAVSPN